MSDINNIVVLTIFAGSIVVMVVGYLLAWRSNRAVVRRTGSLMIAAVAGFAGLFMLWWLIGAVMPLPPGSPVWETLVVLLIFSPLPLGAFYICAKFVRQAFRDQHSKARI
ncbi:MAG: hypothetical protein ACRD51_12690 [Candidatus Acidiferrum sp.]